MSDFHHGHEPRAEEIALHQKYLTLEGQIDAARLEGDEAEARRLTPLVKRAKARWIKANRSTRGRKCARSSSASAPASKVRHEEPVTPDELLVILGAMQWSSDGRHAGTPTAAADLKRS